VELSVDQVQKLSGDLDKSERSEHGGAGDLDEI